jgi:2,5-furandicarboxylate decarboxylase 1
VPSARRQGASRFGVGCDPILAHACQFKVSDDTDDWHVAGGLRGATVELVKCKTIDVLVPATAEVIIAGRSATDVA